MSSPAASDGRLPAQLEAVFLDLGDTLIRAHPSWAGVYAEGLREWGIEPAEGRLEQALLDATRAGSWAFEGPFEPSAQASFERVKEFDSAVLASLGYVDLDEAVFRSIEAAFERASAWHVFPDVVPAIESLRRAGVRLAVVSNWLWGGPELLHSLELARHFESLVISARVGYQKPHRGIFEHALELMRVAADRALHVGDNYQADVVGARRAGIAAVLIDRRGGEGERVRDEHGERDLPIVHDLLELLDLLDIARPAAARPA